MWRVALILVLAVQTVAAEKPARPTCSAETLEKEGDDSAAQGIDVQALAKYELALRCQIAENRVLKAGLTACRLSQHDHNEMYAKKAKRYYDLLKLSPNKQKLAQACAPRCRLEY